MFPVSISPSFPEPTSPAGVWTLQVARSSTPRVLAQLTSWVFAGRCLYCVDGCNRFDPYVFSALARRHGLDPETALARVFVTRCFTIHQMEAVAAEMFEGLLTQRPEPLVAVLGLDFLFLEESVSLSERRAVFARVLRRIEGLRRRGLRILITHDPPEGNGRGWWKEPLGRVSDLHGVAREVPQGALDVEVSPRNPDPDPNRDRDGSRNGSYDGDRDRNPNSGDGRR